MSLKLTSNPVPPYSVGVEHQKYGDLWFVIDANGDVPRFTLDHLSDENGRYGKERCQAYADRLNKGLPQ